MVVAVVVVSDLGLTFLTFTALALLFSFDSVDLPDTADDCAGLRFNLYGVNRRRLVWPDAEPFVAVTVDEAALLATLDELDFFSPVLRLLFCELDFLIVYSYG